MVDTGATSTRTGLTRMLLARPWISGGMVAEKNSVWRGRGSAAMTRLTSWMKPMSSIRSASSRTNTSSAL
ncbi:hypothetical protein ACN28S_07660 [Cystobacter fuscus]